MSRLKQSTFKQKIVAFLQVSRANLLLASFGHATLGMFLGAVVLSDLFSITVFMYIFLHYSIAFFACNINCYYDYQVDARYKTYMSDSVDVITKPWLRIIIIFEFCIAMSLISWFYFQGFILISFLSVLGLTAAFAYSAEPIRLKKRGYYSPFLILFLYSLPVLGGWYVFQQNLSVIILLFLIGYVFMNEGYTLVNMCEDYAEDKQEGITTLAHLFGIRTTIWIAVLFSFLGVFSIFGLFVKQGLQYSSVLDVFQIIVIFLALGLILKAGFEVYEILRFEDLENASKRYGKRLQKWFLITRYPLILCTLTLLI